VIEVEARRPPGRQQYLGLELGGEEHALATTEVVGIARYRSIEPLNGEGGVGQATPDHVLPDHALSHHVLGTIRVRGRTVPGFDLATCCDLPRPPVTPTSCFVILHLRPIGGHERIEAALLVPGVRRVFDVAEADIRRVSDVGGVSMADQVAGLVGVDGDLLPVIDPDRLVTPADLALVARSAVAVEHR
jgi:chemotaxis signal transduction protein